MNKPPRFCRQLLASIERDLFDEDFLHWREAMVNLEEITGRQLPPDTYDEYDLGECHGAATTLARMYSSHASIDVESDGIYLSIIPEG